QSSRLTRDLLLCVPASRRVCHFQLRSFRWRGQRNTAPPNAKAVWTRVRACAGGDLGLSPLRTSRRQVESPMGRWVGRPMSTQAVFVPMLFVLPAKDVPVLVALALAIGLAPAVLRGRVPPSRLIAALGNSWFSLGPAAVLVLANDHLPYERLSTLLLALAAQFA